MAVKYCKPRLHEYAGLSGVPTETRYVTMQDIKEMHGELFAKQWQHFANKAACKFGSDTGYYYYDYKQHALTTCMWLDGFSSF